MKYLLILLFICSTGCTVLKYKTKQQPNYPELGSIGIYSNYLLKESYQPKTIVSLPRAVRVTVSEESLLKRNLFSKKDSISYNKIDSTLVTFEILDKLLLLQQMNESEELISYLKKKEDYALVSEVTMHFPIEKLLSLRASDEVYLVQKKEKTLSLELRKNNKKIETIEFTDGTIVNYKTSQFCWGSNKRREIQLFDLVPSGTNCNEELYRSAKKAKKKNEFKF